MSEQVGIELRVNDNGGSATFQRVGAAASSMASELDRAGSTASSGLSDIDRAAADAGRALSQLDSAAGKVDGNLDDLGRSADDLGRSLDDIGRGTSDASRALSEVASDAGKAEDSLDKLDAAADKSSTGLGKIDAAGATIGAALGGIVGIAGDAARAFEEAEASSRRLDASFEAVGASTADYADRIQAASDAAVALGVDDEELADALGRLVQITGDAGGSIDNLGLVMDIAAARGISLEAAATAVGKAVNGQYTAIQRLGVVVEDGATSTEVLAAAQERFAGQAEANSTAMDRFAVAAGNAMEELGGILAPFNGVLAILPGLQSGFSLVTAAVGGLLGPLGGFSGIVESATAGLGAMGLSLGPVALGLGAIVAVGAAVYTVLDNTAKGAQAAAEAATALQVAAAPLDPTMRGIVDSLALTNQTLDYSNVYLFETGLSLENLGKPFESLDQYIARFNSGLAEAVAATQNAGGSVDDLAFSAGLLESAVANQEIALDTASATLVSYSQIMADSSSAGDALRASLAGIDEDFRNGEISADEYVARVSALLALAPVLAAQTDAYAAAQQRANEAATIGADAYTALLAPSRQYADNLQGSVDGITAYREAEEAANAERERAEEANRRAAASADTFNGSARLNAEALNYLGEQAGLSADEMDRAAEIYAQGGVTIESAIATARGEAVAASNDFNRIAAAAGLSGSQYAEAFRLMQVEGMSAIDAVSQVVAESAALADTFRGQLIPSIDGASESFQGLAQPGEDILDVLQRLGPTSDQVNIGFANLADGLNDTAAAMDSVLGTFDQIDALGQRSQDAADIATGIVGDPGTYAVVDDLLARGAITLQDYNRLQAQQIGIVNDNARAQDALNAIRANQIDDLAIAQAQYADYLVTLSNASEEEQAHALALMDTGEQAKVAAAYSTAYAASLGEIKPEVATEIIASAAQADPVLKGLLEDFGLIEVGADGTVTVNLDGASEATLQQLDAVFGEGAAELQADGLIHVTADDGTEQTYTQFGDFVGIVEKGAEGTVAVNDDGSIAEAKENVDALDGRTATVSIVAELAQGAADFLSGAGDFLKSKAQTVNVSVEVDESELTALYERLGSERTDRAIVVNVEANRANFDATLAAVGESAKPVIVDVEANRQRFDQTLSALGQGGKPIIVNIEGNSQAFDGTLANARKAGDDFASQNFIAELSGNAEAWDGTLAASTDAGAGFDAMNFIAELSANAEAWDATLAASTAAGTGFDAMNFIAELSANSAAFDGTLANATSAGNGFAGTTFTASLAADDSSFQSTVNSLNGRTVGTVYMEIDAVDSDGDTKGGQHGRFVGQYQHGGFADVPRFAFGGRVPTIVGEAGPELAFLPRGTQVVPHDVSKHRAAEAFGPRRGNVIIQSAYFTPAPADNYDAISQQLLSGQF